MVSPAYTYENGAKENTPPASEHHEASGVANQVRDIVAVVVQVRHHSRGNDCQNEREHNEDSESDGVTLANDRAKIHGDSGIQRYVVEELMVGL